MDYAMSSSSSGGGSLEAARGGTLGVRGPTSANYVPVTAAGFEILPEIVRLSLAERAVIGPAPLCASCLNLEVKRRSDGTHYQSGSAWWCDTTRAVLIECRREVKRLEGNKFSPGGNWSVSGVIHHLDDVGGPEESTWEFEGTSSHGKGASSAIVTQDPLDLLPSEVAAPVRGGQSDVWALVSPSSVTEYLTAVKVVDAEVLFLEGKRTARSKQSLHRGAWTLTTLVAPIRASEHFNFQCGTASLSDHKFGSAASGRTPRTPILGGSTD